MTSCARLVELPTAHDVISRRSFSGAAFLHSSTRRGLVSIVVLGFALTSAAGCRRERATTPPPPPVASDGSLNDVIDAAPKVDARAQDKVRINNEAVALVEKGELDAAMRLLDANRELLVDDKPTTSVRVAIHLRRAKAFIDEGQLQKADRETSQALFLAPNDRKAQVSAASVLVERARKADSLSDKRAYLDRALEIDETNRAALVDRAMVAEEDNDLAAARAFLERARFAGAEGAGIDAKLASLKRHESVEATFSDVRSTNFVVRFEGYANEVVAWSAIRGLERAFVRVNERLSLRPPNDITVVLYSGDAYREATGAPDWSGGIFDGKIRVKEGDASNDSARMNDVLFHEYTHALLAKAVNAPIPAWLHEGLAQNLEPSFDIATPLAVLSSTNGSHLPIEALNQSFTRFDANTARVAYAESAVIVHHMIESQGYSGVGRMLALMADGEVLSDAVSRVYATTLARLVAAAVP